MEHQGKFPGSILNMNKRKDYFRQHIGNWNSLPQDIVVAQTIDEFKKQLEKFLEKSSSKAVKHKVLDTSLALKCQWTRAGEYTKYHCMPYML